MTKIEPFSVPDEWKTQFETIQLSKLNVTDYMPLHSDFLRVLYSDNSIDFVIYFAVGWKMYEVVKPSTFDRSKVQSYVLMHKENHTSTRLSIKKTDSERFAKKLRLFLNKNLSALKNIQDPAFKPLVTSYMQLVSSNQQFSRIGLDRELFMGISKSVSTLVSSFPSSARIIRFLVDGIGHDPTIYDHGAVSALVSGCLAWNILELSKRDSKLIIQSALIHDTQRLCAYLGRAPQRDKISRETLDEIKTMINKNEGFHEGNLSALEEFRERMDGKGFPKGKKGRAEEGKLHGISLQGRIVAIGCTFSEFLLKRVDKKPLTIDDVKTEMMQLAESGQLDGELIDKLFSSLAHDRIRDYSLSTQGKEVEACEPDEDF